MKIQGGTILFFLKKSAIVCQSNVFLHKNFSYMFNEKYIDPHNFIHY